MTPLHSLIRSADRIPASARAGAAAVERQPNDSGSAGEGAGAPAYPLRRDAAEHARLAVQAEFWAADAAALFASAAPRGARRVADLGCGTLHVAESLARAIDPAGAVVAVDSDAALLRSLAPAADARIVVETGDAYALAWPDASLDAAHARFLAAPAGRLEALVGEMRRLLRPGGVLMLQEPVGDGWALPAAGDAWPRLLALIRAAFRRRGGDFDAGARLAAELEAAGLGDVRTRTVAHTISASHPYARLPLAFCDSLAPLWRDAGMASDGELAALREEVVRGLAGARANVTTFTLVQAWGRA